MTDPRVYDAEKLVEKYKGRGVDGVAVVFLDLENDLGAVVTFAEGNDKAAKLQRIATKIQAAIAIKPAPMR